MKETLKPLTGTKVTYGLRKPKLELVYVDATLATLLLGKNQVNRHLRPRVVEQYARLMATGGWHDGGGEPILVTVNDEVIGGQHRLHAVIRATELTGHIIEVAMNILWNADMSMRNLQSLTWSASHSLEAAGFKGTAGLAGGINTYFRLQSGVYPWQRTSSPFQSIEDFAIANKEKVEAARVFAQSKNKTRLLPFSTLFAFYYTLSERGENLALVESFLDQINNGTNLSSTDPAFRRREYLLRINRVAQIAPHMLMALLIKSWNAFRSGRPMRSLSFKDTDNFPQFDNQKIIESTH